MFRTFYLENKKNWDEVVPFLMFIDREALQETTGFSPFEHAFEHSVRDPLKVLREDCMQENSTIERFSEYVTRFRTRHSSKACESARENLRSSQCKIKERYDQNAVK